jgi:hypothetical protein
MSPKPLCAALAQCTCVELAFAHVRFPAWPKSWNGLAGWLAGWLSLAGYIGSGFLFILSCSSYLVSGWSLSSLTCWYLFYAWCFLFALISFHPYTRYIYYRTITFDP